MRRLLLLSNSTNFGEPFLQHPITSIHKFLGPLFQKCFSCPMLGSVFPFLTKQPACETVSAKKGERECPPGILQYLPCLRPSKLRPTN